MTDVCIGPCNGAYRRAWADYHRALAAWHQADPAEREPDPPEPPTAKPAPGDPIWCSRCVALIRRALADLDDLCAIAAALAEGHRANPYDQGPVTGSPADASPSPAQDVVDEVITALIDIEDDYRAKMRWTRHTDRDRNATILTTVTSWLLHHLDGILATPGCVTADRGAEILDLHQRARALARSDARRLRKPLRCPSCHLLLLYWTEGDNQVRCANPDCGRILTLAEYEAEVERRAAGAIASP